MTLPELYEPLFVNISALNQSARASGQEFDIAPVRIKILNLLDSIQQTAMTHGISAQYNKVRLPVIYFVDSMISESALPFASRWNEERLARAEGRRMGDIEFFDLLNQTLADASPDAEERLEVFYICLGLGFEGANKGNSKVIRDYLTAISVRIRHRMGSDERICPETYDYTDRRVLHLSTVRPLLVIAVGCAFLLLLAFVFNGVLYLDKTATLRQHLDVQSARGKP
ncbi:MAG TPA: DotU family type IV/VI secretion system protein [Tepidisphaeraceae bacterium]|jgi:type IV/VI secretion system ImpK/VasF family protein|nr:DotU family type IV/VI secretion system protein [Tepidisphaeraceae bacterium]